MREFVRCALAVLALSVTSLPGAAVPGEPTSPVGTWKTIDDNTGKARAIVRIYEQDGRLFGRIEKSLTPGEDGRTCTKCTDERKDQPLTGLVIMRDIRLVDGEYRDGDILDPDNGSVYRCKLRLEEGGRKLVVRGFLGISLFGRSQTWERES